MRWRSHSRQVLERGDNPVGRLPVTVRIHPGLYDVPLWIVEDSAGLGHDARHVRPYEREHASVHSFVALGALTRNEHWHSECRCLLLDASGVGDDDTCLRHQARELRVRERLGQDDVLVVGQR